MLFKNGSYTRHLNDNPGEDLLNVYLSMPVKERQKRFSDTATAAQMTGLAQRTIQLWIEVGSIQAVPVGRKYQVDLNSLWAHLRQCVAARA